MSAGWLLSRPTPAAAAAAAASLPGRENWRLGHVWPASWAPPDVGGPAPASSHRFVSSASVYHERQPEADSLNSSPAPGAAPKGQGALFGSLLGSLSSAGSMAPSSSTLDRPQPYERLWGALAALYGQLLLVLTLALCLAEVLDNHIRLLSLQGIFLMYLYVGSIAVIICIYVWLLVDSCSQLGSGSDAEMGLGSSRFDSLRRAHLPRPGPAGSAFYLRVGALAFGLGTLVFNGLEMAMHAMMEGDCLNDVVFVHPVLHGLFTFLQMHFLFVNSQVLVHRFGAAARLGFMHLAATNVALWLRLVLWESAIEWTYFVALTRGEVSATGAGPPGPLELRGFPRALTSLPPPPTALVPTVAPLPIIVANTSQAAAAAAAAAASTWSGGMGPSRAHVAQVVALHKCLNTNALGQLWTASMPFLYPFIVQFSLIAAAVAFSMGQQVGRSDGLPARPRKKGMSSAHRVPVDCAGASKGLFPGLLALAAAAVVVVIFLVVRDRDLAFPASWLTDGCTAGALLLAAAAALAATWRVRRLPVVRGALGASASPGVTGPHRLLGTAAHAGLLLHGVFGALVGAAGLAEGADEALRPRHALLLAVSLLQVVQAAAQAGLLAEARVRGCVTRAQLQARPGRQALTCLLGANAALWALDTFVAQSWAAQELQLRFFGVLVWGVISRVALPLVAFYRFHGCVLLLDVWRRAYRPPAGRGADGVVSTAGN